MKKRMRIQQLPEAEENSACFPRFPLGLQPRSTTTQEEVFKNGKSGSILKTLRIQGYPKNPGFPLKSSSGKGCGFLREKEKNNKNLQSSLKILLFFSS